MSFSKKANHKLVLVIVLFFTTYALVFRSHLTRNPDSASDNKEGFKITQWISPERVILSKVGINLPCYVMFWIELMYNLGGNYRVCAQGNKASSPSISG